MFTTKIEQNVLLLSLLVIVFVFLTSCSLYTQEHLIALNTATLQTMRTVRDKFRNTYRIFQGCSFGPIVHCVRTLFVFFCECPYKLYHTNDATKPNVGLRSYRKPPSHTYAHTSTYILYYIVRRSAYTQASRLPCRSRTQHNHLLIQRTSLIGR